MYEWPSLDIASGEMKIEICHVLNLFLGWQLHRLNDSA
jgi:hypothetical protein